MQRDRTLRIALLVSVVLNLFALGAAGGAALMWENARHGPPVRARRRLLRAAAEALPPADQARYLALLRGAAEEVRPIRRAARKNRRVAADLFVQPTFDAPAVSSALGRAREADFTLRTRLEAAMVDFAKDLPQAERVVLAKGLARGGPLRQPKPPSER